LDRIEIVTKGSDMAEEPRDALAGLGRLHVFWIKNKKNSSKKMQLARQVAGQDG